MLFGGSVPMEPAVEPDADEDDDDAQRLLDRQLEQSLEFDGVRSPRSPLQGKWLPDTVFEKSPHLAEELADGAPSRG